MSHELVALGWFVGFCTFLAITTPLILRPAVSYYSEAEPQSFVDIEPFGVEWAFYRKLYNRYSVVITLGASAVVACGAYFESADRGAAGALFGLGANAIVGWLVIAEASDEIAADFGYTPKRR